MLKTAGLVDVVHWTSGLPNLEWGLEESMFTTHLSTLCVCNDVCYNMKEWGTEERMYRWIHVREEYGWDTFRKGITFKACCSHPYILTSGPFLRILSFLFYCHWYILKQTPVQKEARELNSEYTFSGFLFFWSSFGHGDLAGICNDIYWIKNGL